MLWNENLVDHTKPPVNLLKPNMASQNLLNIQVMAWHQTGTKPLPEPMLIYLLSIRLIENYFSKFFLKIKNLQKISAKRQFCSDLNVKNIKLKSNLLYDTSYQMNSWWYSGG